jgi:sarcosine oxidase subunit gamma
MAERLSALAHLPVTAADGAGVTLTELRPAAILQVQAWPNSLSTTKAVIAELLGLDAPAVGLAAAREELLVAAAAPGRYLVVGTAANIRERFEGTLPPSVGAVTDLSHGRTMLRLEGDAAAGVLSKCVALDLHSSAFPPGRVAQTMIHHIDVMLHRRAESSFDLWVLRSFAEALAEWLLDAGAEYEIAFSRQADRV